MPVTLKHPTLQHTKNTSELEAYHIQLNKMSWSYVTTKKSRQIDDSQHLLTITDEDTIRHYRKTPPPEVLSTNQPTELIEQKLRKLKEKMESRVDYQQWLDKHNNIITQANLNNTIPYELHQGRFRTLMSDTVINFHLRHNDSLSTKCPSFCYETLYTPQQYLIHMVDYHLCIEDNCNKFLKSPAERRDHYHTKHDSPQKLSCTNPGCTFQTVNFRTLQIHRILETANLQGLQPLYICPVKGCPGNTNTDTANTGHYWTTLFGLAEHYRNYHQKELCAKYTCRFRTTGLIELIKHYNTAHNLTFCPCVHTYRKTHDPYLGHPIIRNPDTFDVNDCPYFKLHITLPLEHFLLYKFQHEDNQLLEYITNITV